jgi:hypothetical protein
MIKIKNVKYRMFEIIDGAKINWSMPMEESEVNWDVVENLTVVVPDDLVVIDADTDESADMIYKIIEGENLAT